MFYADAIKLVRSSNYDESDLDQILDLISRTFEISFHVFIDEHEEGMGKVAILPRWAKCYMEYDFIRSRLITDESDRVIWSVSGKDTKQAKERVLMTLIGNTLYWGEPSKTPVDLLDDAPTFITHEVCRIPTFICLSELKMKLAVAGC